MDPSMVLVLLSGVLLMILHTLPGVKAALVPEADWPVLCPPETFFNRKLRRCLACSKCPINQIITSPCQGIHDTKCGPFYNTELFQHSAENAPLSKSADTKSESENSNAPSGIPGSRDENKIIGGRDLHTGPSEEDFSEWQILTWVICVAIVLLVFVVIVLGILFVRSKLRKVEKQALSCKYSPPPPAVDV